VASRFGNRRLILMPHHIDDPQGTPIGALAVFGRGTGREQPWTPIEEASRSPSS
jgi:hypothetical protein